VFFVIDDVTLRSDLIRIEYSPRLIRDYAWTGNSESIERMILNFAWIVRFLGDCGKRWCSVSGKSMRSSEPCLEL